MIEIIRTLMSLLPLVCLGVLMHLYLEEKDRANKEYRIGYRSGARDLASAILTLRKECDEDSSNDKKEL
jgi:hypothetical protein